MEDKKNPDLAIWDKLFDAQSKMMPIWEKNELYYHSRFSKKQFKKLTKDKRSKIFIPKIRNVVNIVRALFSTAFFSGGVPIELEAQSEEENDLMTKRNKVIKKFYKRLNPNKELLKAFLSALLYRMGVVITYYDSHNEKVVTRHIPITDIAFDDECTCIDDIETIAYVHNESKRVILEKIASDYYNQKKLKRQLFKESDISSARRFKVKTLYTKTSKGYEVKIFIDGILCRVKEFKKLPFQFGFALDKLPAISKSERKDQILCYGGDMVELLKELQKEINHKRNIKNDIQEEILNPSIIVDETVSLDPNELKRGPGKRIKIIGKISGIKERPIPSEYSLNNDLSILEGDFRDAGGVNSIQEGHTSSSDRRSSIALSVVNANSSMRIEEMIIFIKDTLFEHWAKTWVELVFLNASDEEINAITGEHEPFGPKGNRKDFKYDLLINFGMTVDKEKKINDLSNLLQMLLQNQNVNPKISEKLLTKILELRVGEEMNLDDIFNEKDTTNKPSEEDIKKGELDQALL